MPRRPGKSFVTSLISLLALVALASAMLAGCGASSPANGTPTTAAAEQTPAVHVVLDANAAAANSVNDLRFSAVALDTHDGHVAWRHRLETPAPNLADIATLPPLLQGGLVYVGYYYFDPQTEIHHAVLEALDPTTGQTRWRHEAGTELSGEPVVVGSVVYLSATVFQTPGQQPIESGLVEALDSRTGSVRWSRALTDAPTMPAIAGDQVFVITSQQFAGQLLALSARDGSVLWKYTSGAPLSRGSDAENGWSTAPIVVNQLVYVQGAERYPDGTAHLVLHAVNTRDGSLAWQHETGGIAAAPAVNQSADTLCVSAFRPSQTGGTSTVVGLVATTGQTRWISTVSAIASACVAAGETFSLSEATPGYNAGSVLVLNSQDGRQRWKAAVSAPIDADGLLPPSVSSGLAAQYVQAPTPANGPVMSAVAVVRIADGRLVWQRDFAGRPDKVMDVEGDQIYVPEQSGPLPLLAAYSLSTGALLWTYTFGNA
jgi:outer membrane protein assembly factor BamB